MDIVVYLLSTPIGTALVVGGPAVVVGGLILLFIRRFIGYKGKSLSNLRPLPGIFILLVNQACK